VDQYEHVVDERHARDLAEALVTRLLRQPGFWILSLLLYGVVALVMVTLLDDDPVSAAVGALVATGCGVGFLVHQLRVKAVNNARVTFPEGTVLLSAFGDDSFVTENHFWTTRWRYEAVRGVDELGRFVQLRYVSGARNVYPRELFPDSALARIRSRMTMSPTAHRTP
jgi:hypothetical protein